MNDKELLTDGWWIPHPGNGGWQWCATFNEAMHKWFEGFNPPRFVKDGKVDSLKVAIKRVAIHYQNQQ